MKKIDNDGGINCDQSLMNHDDYVDSRLKVNVLFVWHAESRDVLTHGQQKKCQSDRSNDCERKTKKK